LDARVPNHKIGVDPIILLNTLTPDRVFQSICLQKCIDILRSAIKF